MAKRNLAKSDYKLIARIVLNYYAGGDIDDFAPEEGDSPQVQRDYERIQAIYEVYGPVLEYFTDHALEETLAERMEGVIAAFELVATTAFPEEAQS